MILKNLIATIKEMTLTNDYSECMAVPKKRRSKAKGKTRLANWKKKAKKAATKAYNAAKTFFSNEKKAATLKENEEQILDN